MHKDVKTDNFCMNEEHGRITSIHAIDYGFSRPAFGEQLAVLQAATALERPCPVSARGCRYLSTC
jgi:hypothetical protein